MDLIQGLSALGNVAVIVGIVLGLLQLRHLVKQRQEDMVLRAFSPFLDPEFSRAFWRVMTWKFATFEQFEAEASLEDMVTLDVVSMQYETMAMLYKRGLADIDTLVDVVGEPALMTWNRIAPLILGFRAKEHAPTWGQGHEMLAMALDRRMTALGLAHVQLDPAYAGSSASMR